MNLRGLIFDNFLIKLVSFFFAGTLWFYVTSKGDLEMNFAVPLELRNVPADLMIRGEVPNYVNVRLKGRQSVIRGLNPDQVHVGVDLSDARVGENHFTLTDENLRLPRAIDVVRIVPRAVKIRMIRVKEKDAAVQGRMTEEG